MCTEFEPIGKFELTKPVLRVSDPCYEKDIWCSYVLDHCRIGTWEAAVFYYDGGILGRRPARLVIRYNSGPMFDAFENSGLYDINEAPFVAGVDSGQCGFFADDFYPDDSICDRFKHYFCYLY